MDLGANDKLIFQDRTEAMVAAELLEKAGRADIVDQFAPPLSAVRLGYLAFLFRLRDERNGIVHYGMHRIEDPGASREAVSALIKRSNMKFTPPPKTAVRKRDYMGSKLLELGAKITIQEEFTAELESVIVDRREFIARYFAERGWDINRPELIQILEVRAQPEWIQAEDRPD